MTDPAMPTGRHALLAALAGIGLALAVLFAATADRGLPPDPPPNSTASWHRDYHSFEELLDEPSSVALDGRVVERLEVVALHGIPFTRSAVRVERVLAGESTVEGDTVTVRQTGGTIRGGRAVYISELRLLRPGDHVLLFLIPEPVSGDWAITGGPFGHFMIDGDEVRSATLEDFGYIPPEEHPLVTVIRGKTLAEISAEVESLWAAQVAR
ncbi:MAG: hypothetical protein O2798_09430 [Chloroflexi bacterium]|nr:hypothetical protein [Chloroflexota bacterium]MDA1241048.1 hypothetical protein [Chloroflexota bacterium]